MGALERQLAASGGRWARRSVSGSSWSPDSHEVPAAVGETGERVREEELGIPGADDLCMVRSPVKSSVYEVIAVPSICSAWTRTR